MSIRAGLVGLPNVGKSTLFNALTKSSVPAENYPFCTIDPHLAITEVPDERATKLQSLYTSEKIIPATVSFVDIAGLVKGAAAGEGLGNQFLSHIREVDLILHVLRCFEDSRVTSTQQAVNPLEDYAIIVSELMLKDIESVDKRIAKVAQLIKAAKNKPAELKELEAEQIVIAKIKTALEAGDNKAVRALMTPAQEVITPLLCAKRFLIIANIAEHELENDAYLQNPHVQSLLNFFGKGVVIPISAKIEYEISQLPDQEAQDMMSMMGIKQRGLDTIIQKSYHNLGLITFFTCGPKEIHAWPIKKGMSVRKAAGEIHSDLERGFICAEVFNCHDLFELGSVGKVKERGKMRTEGQDYIVLDGDILNIKFNV
jgi:GTP-binding protein YchF